MTDTATVETSLEIAAHPDDVWQAVSTPAGLARWMGEGAQLDEDGSLRLPDPVGGKERHGLVTHASPVDRQLSFVWWPSSQEDEQSHVSITVVPTSTGSKVTATETRTTPIASAGAKASASAMSFGSNLWVWRLAMLAVGTALVCAV